MMNSFLKDMNFKYPLISIHIRHGIHKVTCEAGLVKEEKYLQVADIPKIRKRRVYVASDSEDILEVLKSRRPNYELPRESICSSRFAQS